MGEFTDTLRAAAKHCPTAARELREASNDVASRLQFCEGLLASAAMLIDDLEADNDRLRALVPLGEQERR